MKRILDLFPWLHLSVLGLMCVSVMSYHVIDCYMKDEPKYEKYARHAAASKPANGNRCHVDMRTAQLDERRNCRAARSGD